MNNKWDPRFLSLAKFISSWSLDPNTQVGAVLARGKHVISLGFNGFPQRIADDVRLFAREEKNELIIHAEMNAIHFAKGDTQGATLYTWPLLPCLHCAKDVIQVGITKVVSVPFLRADWQERLAKSQALFKEAGVEVVILEDTCTSLFKNIFPSSAVS